MVKARPHAVSEGENRRFSFVDHQCRGLGLEQDDLSSNRHPALAYRRSMIFSENRFTLFGIKL
jgi:hypothetical protein